MAYVLRLFPIALFSAVSIPLTHAQVRGLAPEWDVRKNMTELSGEVRRLKPILEQVNPQDWLSKGAPDAYVGQHKSVKNEIDYLAGSAEKLAANPEKLSLALDTMFRMQSIEALVGSFAEGIRKYQNPALADLLRSTLTSSVNNREKLRTYIVDLATLREQEFDVANREAQRCRAQLSRQPGEGRELPSSRSHEKKLERK